MDARQLQDEIAATLDAWDAARSTERLWSKDASLWPAGAAAWLGWLDVAVPPRAELDDIARRAGTVAPDARDVLLIGMGGSSLAPEVIANTIDAQGRRIRVLDSTEPTFVHEVFAQTDWSRTIILVASKSGNTLEPDILLRAALSEAERTLGANVGTQCMAITDPGSALEQLARSRNFAEIFLGEPSIGGRFSALSPFGLVPAALHGLDLHTFVEPAGRMAIACRDRSSENPGVQLGAYMAMAAKAGRDKCTLILPDSMRAIGAWIEQLVAESTGKNGMVILPIDGEDPGAPDTYGFDRAFVHLRDGANDDGSAEVVAALEAAGHPVFTIDVASPAALAGEFFRWEFATAVAGSLLGVNPFDQPDVEASKIATRAITQAYERSERIPPVETDDVSEVSALLAAMHSGDYFAILAFLPMFPDVRASLERIRTRVRDAKRVATSVGFGPRFLHSTGQAFKGGPNTGVFLQLTCAAEHDLAVPGRQLTFASVVNAQAAGDRNVLRDRGRRIVHLHLEGDLLRALGNLEDVIAKELSAS